MKINTNRVIELTLVFFITLFSFSIGTFVGKKYSDNQHRLAQLEPNKPAHGDEHASSEVASSESEHAAATEHGSGEHATAEDATKDEHAKADVKSETKEDGALTDADVAKMAEEFSNETPATSEHGDKAKEKTTATTTKTEKKEEHKAEHNPEKSASHDGHEKDVKEITDSTARDVASIPPNGATLQYTVQVGAFPTSEEADKMTSSLVTKGYKASAIAATVNGKTVYRVQVGLFDSLAKAQEHKKELMEKNRITSAFVQKVNR